MTDYQCPSCRGGFPAPADECPWCAKAMDGDQSPAIGAPVETVPVPNTSFGSPFKDESEESINKTAEPDPLTDEAVQFEDTRGEAEITQVFSVRDSQGYGIELTGADDSFVESDEINGHSEREEMEEFLEGEKRV